jgi:hypothetical protein
VKSIVYALSFATGLGVVPGLEAQALAPRATAATGSHPVRRRDREPFIGDAVVTRVLHPASDDDGSAAIGASDGWCSRPPAPRCRS